MKTTRMRTSSTRTTTSSDARCGQRSGWRAGYGLGVEQRTVRIIAIVLLIAIAVFLLSVLWDPISALWR